MSSPTSESEQIASVETHEQQESDDKHQYISSPAGLKDEVLDPHKQQDDLENLRCHDEEDLKKEIDEAEQQIANEETQTQQESDDKQQHISSPPGLKDEVLDQFAHKNTDEKPDKQQDDLDNLRCHDEEDLKKEINEAEQGKIEAEHGNIIRTYLRNQLPAVFVTSLDKDVRAAVIDVMLASKQAASFPLAAHLAVLIFDNYFATFSENEAEKALNPHTVLSSAFGVAVKHLYAVEVSAENKGVQFQILNPINYRLNIPTTKTLVDVVLNSTRHAPTFQALCTYLTELALLDRECSEFQIDILAAACFSLASFIFDYNTAKIEIPWNCDAQRLKDAVTLLHELFLSKRLPQCECVRKKYSTAKLENVANFPCPSVIPD